MSVRKEILFVVSALILSILSCNLPFPISTEAEGADITATPLTLIITATSVSEITATAIPTETPIPFTPTPQVAPEITLTKNSNCRLGPSTYYNIVDQIAAGKILPVLGRSEDNTWWQVRNATNRECWIFNDNATPNTDFSALSVGDALPLPGIPQSFFVVDQLCQPGPKKFSVTLSWSSGGGETAFRLFRDGKQLMELKATKFNYKDANAPLNKNISYEIEAVNENGVSERAIQIVPACK